MYDSSLLAESGKIAKDARQVNQQVRGELAGQKSQEGVDSIGIGGRLKAGALASEVNLVSQEIRGEGAGQQKNLIAHSYVGSGRSEIEGEDN